MFYFYFFFSFVKYRDCNHLLFFQLYRSDLKASIRDRPTRRKINKSFESSPSQEKHDLHDFSSTTQSRTYISKLTFEENDSATQLALLNEEVRDCAMSYRYLQDVRKIICIGRNYAAHIAELNSKTPKQPFFFLKPSSSIITPITQAHPRRDDLPTGACFHGLREDGGNPSCIYLPKGTDVHHEVELALIMDKYVSNAQVGDINAGNVFDLIRGVALSFDLTARNIQFEAKDKGLPWSIAKGFDTFLPMSHFIPKDELSKDKDNLQDVFKLVCKVNGEVRQNEWSSLMLNPLEKIIQVISTTMTLEPGDIILTGTPSGVGQIQPGDEISGELFYGDKQLVDMKFDCEERPGPYVFTET
ncbi:Fmp41p NDAI_0F03280 [Naumovozyma dairenensis CBS 421]|uniref:Fumarylacetoacetase-like C-terminal domain-containing protein n=1 Tax=Naumovozyma dairenensis (strain ATCC 10597 / BCRC 20456 / CBS 421 / NBRC 0211 / NRRL Y-12639) TaxID=1071378 RepID=G0WCY5_NAUDC|nr:hypothetical protein NDAI_0F03280 [Naumovozyma dairenensis CBS 421]CCD25646.1 hypothetical protein NDAI_0F03280 [Naumovozyma dairenensis CBS 421]